MSLVDRLAASATRVGAEIKTIKGRLTSLETDPPVSYKGPLHFSSRSSNITQSGPSYIANGGTLSNTYMVGNHVFGSGRYQVTNSQKGLFIGVRESGDLGAYNTYTAYLTSAWGQFYSFGRLGFPSFQSIIPWESNDAMSIIREGGVSKAQIRRAGSTAWIDIGTLPTASTAPFFCHANCPNNLITLPLITGGWPAS